MENMNMVISHLPSLTWNRLGVNSAAVSVEANATGSVEFTSRGNGVVGESTISAADADAMLKGVKASDKKETYVAGKTRIYQDQEFATGLGGEFTTYMRTNAPDVRLYEVGNGVHAADPVILNWNFGKGADDASRQLIKVGDDAEATIVLVYQSENEAAGVSAVETDVVIGKNAKLHLMKVNLLGEGFTHLDDTGAVIEESGVFDFVQMEMGAAKAFVGCYADQMGKGAEFHVHTGYAFNSDRLLDMNYIAGQFGRQTVSAIDVKGVLADKAVKVFRGTIDFRNGSAGSVGDEQEDVLLLGDDVINKTVPVILCEEEDVDGRHGASIGRLDEDMLFYLGTRGISEQEAEKLMLRGRLVSIARMIPDSETIRGIEEKIDAFGTEE